MILSSDKNIFLANKNNIWNYRQNHPELVIKDCKRYGFSENMLFIVRQSMLVRGINKWLKVRRDLIAYKKQIKHEIKELFLIISNLKQESTKLYSIYLKNKNLENLWNYHEKHTKYMATKEVLKVKTETRGVLKKLCMTDRWQIWENKKLKDMNTLKVRD